MTVTPGTDEGQGAWRDWLARPNLHSAQLAKAGTTLFINPISPSTSHCKFIETSLNLKSGKSRPTIYFEKHKASNFESFQVVEHPSGK